MQCAKGTRFLTAWFSCFPIDAVSLLKQVKFTENFPTARASTLASTWSKANHSLIQTFSRMEGKGIRICINHMCRREGKHVRQTILRSFTMLEKIEGNDLLRTVYLG